MAYVPNDTWASDTPITVEKLNHMQTQHSEIISYLDAHNHDSLYYAQEEMDSYFWNIDDGSGSGLDADTLEGTEASAIRGGIEPGIIIYWYGSLSSFTGKLLTIDTSWHIADGTDGTIDLLDYFVIGAGGDYAVGVSGGNSQFKPAGVITIASHTLAISEIMHTHSMTDYYPLGDWGATTGYWSCPITYAENNSGVASTTISVGGGQGHNHPGSFAGNVTSLLPPYMALIPIQKMES